MTEFINLFFLPVISVSIFYGFKQEMMKLNASFLARYCIFVPLVFLGARLVGRIVGLFHVVDDPLYSADYTALALVAAVLLPCLLGFFQTYFEVVFESKDINHENKN